MSKKKSHIAYVIVLLSFRYLWCDRCVEGIACAYIKIY